MALFKGAGVALVTPFKDGDVDYNSLERLINWQIDNDIDAIISCGTTGEASTLSVKEQLSVIDFTVRKVDGRVPVIAGSGSNNTSTAMFLAKEIEELGVNGLLIVTPYYNKCTQKGLQNHYEMIADYTELPIMSLGGVGCISTVANIIPKEYHQMINYYSKGNIRIAQKMQLKMKPLIEAIFAEVNPIPIKAALNIMGMIEKEYRMPLCEPSNETLYWIYDEMKKFGIKI